MGLMLVELTLECEERFRVRLKDEDVSCVVTVKDMADLVVKELQAKAASENRNDEIIPDQVLQQVRAIIAVELRLPIENVKPKSRFVKDLGCD